METKNLNSYREMAPGVNLKLVLPAIVNPQCIFDLNAKV